MEDGRSPSHAKVLSIVLWSIAAVFLYLLIFFRLFPGEFYAVRSLVLTLGCRALILGASLIVVGGATALGAVLIGKMLPESRRLERVLFGAGLGLGLVSLLVLLLAHISVKLLALVFCACAVMLLLMKSELKVPLAFPRDSMSRWVIVIFAAVLFFNLLACFLPPVDYDVIEYHLGAPAEYVRHGRMHFLPHNVYANFPANVEMLYLLGLSLGGLPFGGASMAKILNLLLMTLAAGGVYCLGTRFVGERAALLAAAALYVHPLVTTVSIKAYVEGGLVLYTVLSLYAACSFAKSGSWRWAAIAGASAGLAAGCKYTAVIFVVIPVVAYVALAGRKLAPVAAAVLCFSATFAPWALKNTINTRNPVYPLAYQVFGGSNWSPELDARFMPAHRPAPETPERSGLPAAGAFLENMLGPAVNMRSGSIFLFVFVPISLFVGLDRKLILHCACYFLLCFVLWYTLTHRMERFLVPALPAVCILAGAGADLAAKFSPVLKWTATTLLLLTALLLVILAHISMGAVGVASVMRSETEWLRETTQGSTYSWEAVQHINQLEGEPRVLLIGEAQVYYLQTPIVYSVVFNDDITERLVTGTPQSVLERLRREGITHVFLNWHEVARLRNFYSYEYQGKKYPGYLPHMSMAQIHRLTQGMELVSAWGPRPPVEAPVKHRPWELYAVPGAAQ